MTYPFKIKKGKLSNQLNIPERKDIPLTLLRKIKNAKLNTYISNPTKSGKKRIKVTKLLKQRAVFAFNSKTKFK